MTTVRSVRSTAYGAKLFAYVLAVAAVGGGLLGLGYSLAWPTVADVVLGGASAESPATLAAGSALGLLGVYVLGTGLFATLHKLVADGIASGVESAAATVDGAATPAGDTDRAGSPGQSASDPGQTAATDTPDRPGTAPDSGSEEASTPDRAGDAVPGPADADDSAGERSSPGDPGTAETVSADEGGAPDPGDAGNEETGPTDRPPEPSPEEIAFGSVGDGDQEPGPKGGADGGTVTERSDWFEEEADEESNTGADEERAEGTGRLEPAGSTAVSDPLADPDDAE